LNYSIAAKERGTITMHPITSTLRLIGIAFGLLASAGPAFAADLESWSEGPTRQAILDYVKKVTDSNDPAFIQKEARVAVFDNDGTLWSEKPLPAQLQFTIDRVHQLASQHPEWSKQQPFKAVLKGDQRYLSQITEQDALKLLSATHTGMTQAEFQKIIEDWFRQAKDSRTGRLYTHRTYQPMTELLSYLQSKGFKTYVVTGGGREFVRGFSQRAYGIPPEQIIGSSVRMKYKEREGKPTLIREAKIAPPINLNEGKPLNIEHEIGRIPVIAVGNSDVDLQMLEYSASNLQSSLKLLISHDDAVREVAYTEGTEKVLAEAKKQHWTIASMKNDFKTIYGTD
jgi:phosphoserine phosphatase